MGKLQTKPKRPNMNDYHRSASNDVILHEIMKRMDKCSESQDNGSWGCAGCRKYKDWFRLIEKTIIRSVIHHLDAKDKAVFEKEWSVIQEELGNGKH